MGDEGGGLIEVSEVNNNSRTLSEWSILACQDNLNVVKMILNNSCRAIGSRLGWNPGPIEDEQIGIAFTHWIQSNSFKHLVDLDLSNLNIQILPPQINPTLFPHLKKINLSNNQLSSMPKVLKNFSFLEVDVNGNAILQSKFPDWLDNIDYLQHVGNNTYMIKATSQPRRV
jgi:hypothetical protein